MTKKENGKQKKKISQYEYSKTKREFEDDRTPFVKKIDMTCRCLAVLLAVMCIISLHLIVRGGGYNSENPVFILGYSISNLEKDGMEPEIEAGSAVLLKYGGYEEGDIVFYSSEYGKNAGRIKKSDKKENLYFIKGDNENEEIIVENTAIDGKIIASSKLLYKFFDIYLSVMGVAGSILLCFLLIMIPDILMFKKRKEAAKAKREAYAKKQARKLKVKQGMVKQEDLTATPKEVVEKKRREKIDKEKAEIEIEMKKMRKKMEAEENELGLGGKR